VVRGGAAAGHQAGAGRVGFRLSPPMKDGNQ